MNIKKIWNDPVWSKVISAVIIAIGSITIAIISSKINDKSFQKTLIQFTSVKLPLWLLLIFLSIFLIFFKIKRRKKEAFKYDDETLELDKKTFQKIKEILPPNGSMTIIRNLFSFMGIKSSHIVEIENFEDYSKQPDFEFLNPELEKVKLELVEKVNVFMTNTFFLMKQVGDKREIHPPKKDNEDKFKANMKHIDNSAKEVYLKYDELIKLCRRVLKV